MSTLLWSNEIYRIYASNGTITLSKWRGTRGRDRNVMMYQALDTTDTRIPKSVRDAYHEHNKIQGA